MKIDPPLKILVVPPCIWLARHSLQKGIDCLSMFLTVTGYAHFACSSSRVSHSHKPPLGPRPRYLHLTPILHSLRISPLPAAPSYFITYHHCPPLPPSPPHYTYSQFPSPNPPAPPAPSAQPSYSPSRSAQPRAMMTGQ